MHRLVQQHAASFMAHTKASTGSELPRFIKEEFDAWLECGILAHGFLRLRCNQCRHGELLAFRCKRRGLQPLVRRATGEPGQQARRPGRRRRALET